MLCWIHPQTHAILADTRSSLARNFGILIGYIVFFTATYLLAAEYISMDTSKGEVLIFRRGHGAKPSEKVTQDEESGTQDARLPSATPNLTDDETLDIQRQEGILHWRDLCYDITIKGHERRILDHVDGWVRPGTLTALMVRKCILCMCVGYDTEQLISC